MTVYVSMHILCIHILVCINAHGVYAYTCMYLCTWCVYIYLYVSMHIVCIHILVRIYAHGVYTYTLCVYAGAAVPRAHQGLQTPRGRAGGHRQVQDQDLPQGGRDHLWQGQGRHHA